MKLENGISIKQELNNIIRDNKKFDFYIEVLALQDCGMLHEKDVEKGYNWLVKTSVYWSCIDKGHLGQKTFGKKDTQTNFKNIEEVNSYLTAWKKKWQIKDNQIIEVMA
jgi:hypothetical protein